jgi:hypothetical protein
MEKELQKEHYLNLLTEKQLEKAFQRGVMIVDRQKVDLKKYRSKALEIYYNEVISPELRKKFSDNDFLETSKFYLAGGGAFYPELIELFKKEYQSVVDVIVPSDPNLCAGIGYCINSLEQAGMMAGAGDERHEIAYVGIDLGNSNTVVVIEVEGTEPDEIKNDKNENEKANDQKEAEEINIQQN